MTCLTFAATPLVGSIDPATGVVFGTFLGFSSAALLLIGESARRTVGIVYLNENKDKVCKYLSFKEIFLSNFFFKFKLFPNSIG